MSQEQFGTQIAVYNKLWYNVRGQLSEIRASTSYTGPGDTSWNRGAIINQYAANCWACSGPDNNGNLQRQEVYVPHNDQVSSYTSWHQAYSYDNLNRLTQVREYGSGQLWQQTYSYPDQYGNRLIDQGQTWGAGIPKPQFTIDASTNRLGVPTGQSGLMQYDAAGNLTNDTYTGSGSRLYDAENRMVAADGMSGRSRYAYDAYGQRVRRSTNADAVWQIYGFDGELVAEYLAAASSPLKEYGYRNGQLLVTASNQTATNWALWGTASQSSTHAPGVTDAAKAIDNQTDGFLWSSHASATNSQQNAWWQVDLGAVRQLTNIQVWGRTDCCPEMSSDFYVFVSDNPFTSTDLNTTINQSGVSNYYTSGASNNPTTVAVNRSGRYIRVQFAYNSYLVLAEVQAWGQQSATTDVEWLVTDQLGTPRMVIDQSGSLTGVKRHDYLPFGEELSAGVGLRNSAPLGYVSDSVRQKFTGKERDAETRLDYFLARYYSPEQGRFTSPDPLMSSARAGNPQSWNRYAYVLSNPLNLVDPLGLQDTSDEEKKRKELEEKQREQFEREVEDSRNFTEKVKINSIPAYGLFSSFTTYPLMLLQGGSGFDPNKRPDSYPHGHPYGGHHYPTAFNSYNINMGMGSLSVATDMYDNVYISPGLGLGVPNLSFSSTGGMVIDESGVEQTDEKAIRSAMEGGSVNYGFGAIFGINGSYNTTKLGILLVPVPSGPYRTVQGGIFTPQAGVSKSYGVPVGKTIHWKFLIEQIVTRRVGR
jgi:RHS repeat-associated protein